MVGELTVGARHETEEEQRLRLQILAEEERQLAYAAVAKAMATYRWWGWTSIVITFRMFLTSCRIKLGMKLWP